MDKLKQAKKLATLEIDPKLAIFSEIQALNAKLKALYGSIKAENSKEVITYQNELKTLHDAILSLTEVVKSKDTIVNIPLDQLASQIVKVEQAIKAIKEVKIPEFPTEFSINELQINELLLAIQSIPEFPVDELKKMVESIGKKIEAIKFEKPEGLDYDFFRDKFIKLEKAIKGISISVSAGGGGSGSSVDVSGLATEATLSQIENTTVNIDNNLTAVKNSNSVSNQEEIRVSVEALRDEANSSAHALVGGDRFRGEWIDHIGYNEIDLSIWSDVPSERDEVIVEWSADADLSHATDRFSYSTDEVFFKPLSPKFRYHRVSYTNGGNSQTYFFLQTMLRKVATGGEYERVKTITGGDRIGRLVNSYPKVKVGNSFFPVSGNEDGAMNVSDITTQSLASSIATILTSIKNTDGIKKITNPVTITDGAEIAGGISWLKRIFSALKPLSVVQGSGSNRLSISVDAGTLPAVTTVSTVSTVSNQTNIGGVNAFALQQASLRNAFANGIRNNIV